VAALIVITLPSGVMLPQSTLDDPWLAVLATFVAINTLMYASLAVAKMLPKVYPGDWFDRSRRRVTDRSIDGSAPPTDP
jgi:hypothetical protein